MPDSNSHRTDPPHAHPDRTEFVHLTLPADPAHLPPLRNRLRGCLAALPMPPTRQDEVILAVAEAAANVVEHAYPNAHDDRRVVELTFWTEADALWVEIRDHGRWREPPESPRPTGQGLGIPLMRRLMDCVLIHHDDHGTNVLLRHPMAQPAPDRPRRSHPHLSAVRQGAHRRP
jgi:anti-sigma regulatory factor (Ser/Thr protein kinase)